MARKGDDHGGNGKPAKEVQAMQKRFVEGVLAGEKPGEAKLAAGYSPTTQPHDILESIHKALEKRGITVDKLAAEYQEGIELSKSDGAREIDLHSHSQYLKQLGWLLGANRKAAAAQPAVAVQINNSNPNGRAGVSLNGKPVPDAGAAALHEPGGLEAATRAALADWRALREDLGRVDEEIGRRELGDFLGGGAGVEDSGPHP